MSSALNVRRMRSAGSIRRSGVRLGAITLIEQGAGPVVARARLVSRR